MKDLNAVECTFIFCFEVLLQPKKRMGMKQDEAGHS